MKILIAGANSILTKAILYQHTADEVDVLYHSQPLREASNNHPISNYKDLNDDYDLVFIVSASITNDMNQTSTLFDVNVNLIKDLSKHFSNSKLIYFSTVAIYDGLEAGNITEKTKPSPESVYGISKLWGEKIVQEHSRFAIIRISSMFGIGMKETTFLPRIIEDALSKNKISLLGDGSRKQNYIHANDVAVLAKKMALETENRIQLAIASENYSNAQVAEIIKEFTGCEIVYQGSDNSRSLEYQQNTIPYSDFNLTLMKEGIKELIEWKRKQF